MLPHCLPLLAGIIAILVIDVCLISFNSDSAGVPDQCIDCNVQVSGKKYILAIKEQQQNEELLHTSPLL